MILSYDMILENLPRTDRQTNKQTENSKPEATLIPVDRRGERANRQTENSNTEAILISCGSSGGAGQYNTETNEYIDRERDSNTVT